MVEIFNSEPTQSRQGLKIRQAIQPKVSLGFASAEICSALRSVLGSLPTRLIVKRLRMTIEIIVFHKLNVSHYDIEDGAHDIDLWLGVMYAIHRQSIARVF
jgi:hypothetical protein